MFLDVNDRHTLVCLRKRRNAEKKRKISLEVGLDLSHVLVTIGVIACVLFFSSHYLCEVDYYLPPGNFNYFLFYFYFGDSIFYISTSSFTLIRKMVDLGEGRGSVEKAWGRVRSTRFLWGFSFFLLPFYLSFLF